MIVKLNNSLFWVGHRFESYAEIINFFIGPIELKFKIQANVSYLIQFLDCNTKYLTGLVMGSNHELKILTSMFTDQFS